MSTKTTNFINTVAPVAQALYAERKTVLPSVCIAQAALESGWNVNAKTVFGIKGSGYTAQTQEFINGQMVTVQASFKSYPSLTASVVGYYDLMAKDRYKAVKNLSTPEEQINYIWKAGYATDPNYVSKIVSIINTYGLKSFDSVATKTTATTKKSNEEIAREVIQGKWGNGATRKTKLTNAGYNYSDIQKIVNNLLK